MSDHKIAIGLLEHTLNAGVREEHAGQLLASIELLRNPPVDTKSPFEGTPEDWWNSARRVSRAEADNRKLGNWYIVRQRTAGKTLHSYRLMTPSRPPQTDKMLKSLKDGSGARYSENVRLLIQGSETVPAWMNAEMVIADFDRDTAEGLKIDRQPWVRKNGRWHAVFDGRRSINDHTMAELNPVPAAVQEV